MNLSLELRRKTKRHHFLFVHFHETSVSHFAADTGTRLELSQHNFINMSKEKQFLLYVRNKRLRMMSRLVVMVKREAVFHHRQQN